MRETKKDAKSLKDWAKFYGVPEGTFRRWANSLRINAPYSSHKARKIALFGVGKSQNGKGASINACQRNHENLIRRIYDDTI